MKDAFSGFHPWINFSYFVSVIGISMFIMHPIFLIVSLLGAIAYSIYLNGRRAFRFNFFMTVPALLLMALVNPTFNHRGETILLYVNDNPLTLESIVYGLVTAAMLVAMILWFSCYNSVMTSDKFIYLFGSIIPSLSLMLSMALRFVPRFKAQIKVISNAQKCVGRDISQGNLWERLNNGLLIISIMTTWVLENSIDTADSMKARGYGLRGRTAFSIYRFSKRDRIVFLIICGMVFIIAIGFGSKTIYSMYIPRILINAANMESIIVYLCYLVLCFIPVIINIWEDMKWNYLISRI
ncbi:energy-coupling factor transporter transmembrane component T [Anaerocolumna sp.]|uniref:energy-coupling factor transporter transmembrane component T n=1 Tax=Anaerocolumna sp. TaxID=2041569 RepID=UPI0028AC7524|nr:energy-coupling factor transporter transmembrane component T [Anaerocolumna sp.]